MIITHYFPSSIQNKFSHSITEYNTQQQFDIAKKLAQCDGRALRRFDKFEEYISRRVKTEEWLYEMFLEINGLPKTKNPFYFVLGEHDDLRHDFGSESSYIQLDTDQILDSFLSFTIGDSMSVLFSDAPKRIYTISQIKEIVNDTTFIDRQFEHITPNHRYIEAQLWDKRYLQGHDNKELSNVDVPVEYKVINTLVISFQHIPIRNYTTNQLFFKGGFHKMSKFCAMCNGFV